MKKIYYKLQKTTINLARLLKITIDVIIQYYSLPDIIIINISLLFILYFWSLLCYFFGIKKKLSIAFHSQTNNQIKRQNSTIEAYLKVFIYFESNNQVRLLLMAKFIYNNAKIMSIDYIFFELNYNYYLFIFFEKNTNLHFYIKTENILSIKLRELKIICQNNFYYT